MTLCDLKLRLLFGRIPTETMQIMYNWRQRMPSLHGLACFILF